MRLSRWSSRRLLLLPVPESISSGIPELRPSRARNSSSSSAVCSGNDQTLNISRDSNALGFRLFAKPCFELGIESDAHASFQTARGATLFLSALIVPASGFAGRCPRVLIGSRTVRKCRRLYLVEEVLDQW